MYRVVDRPLNCHVFVREGPFPGGLEVQADVELGFEGACAADLYLWRKGDPPPEERLWQSVEDPRQFMVTLAIPQLTGYRLMEGYFCGVFASWEDYATESGCEVCEDGQQA